MHRTARTCRTLLLLLAVGTPAAWAQNEGRIHGRVTTARGETLEGFIRWDKNEASWVDLLDGSKEIPEIYRRQNENRRPGRRKTLTIFGQPVLEYISDQTDPREAQSGIRFGHLRTLEVAGTNRVALTLQSGDRVELSGGSTDLGTDIRELIVEDRSKGEVKLQWRDLRRIDFSPARAGATSSFGERLYGTLTTRRGDQFSGYVAWDVDEIFTSDILDGEEGRADRKIPFGEIASIESDGSRGARVTLKSGDRLELRGSNDVNSSNRGIIISDPGFGQIIVRWREFDKLIFLKPPPQARAGYDTFGKTGRLRGTVHTLSGEAFSGMVRWDNDEEFSWEILDGKARGVDFDIEFGMIRFIEKTPSGARVTVLDGRVFELSDSNDVDDNNKGIFITQEDGREVIVDWPDFRRLDLTPPK